VRIAVVYPDRPRWPKMRWVACALRRLGHEVTRVDTVEKLAAADRESDLVIFCQKEAGLNCTDVAALGKTRRSSWVCWWFDLLALVPGMKLAEQPTMNTYTSQQIWEPTGDLQFMRLMDRVFVKEQGQLVEFNNLGVSAEWLDQGCPRWLDRCEHREIPEWDVLIYGTTCKDWRQRRTDANGVIAEGFAVAWAGHAAGSAPAACLSLPFCPAPGLPALASRSAVTLCCSLRSDVEGYTSDRFWLALGMGACVVARRWPGMPEAEGRFWAYETEKGLHEAVHALRRDRDRREEIGRRAREWVQGEKLIEHRCEEMLKRCKETKESAASVAVREK